MAFLGSLVIYKTVFWSGYAWVILPTIPFAILEMSRKNVVENLKSSIEYMWLEENGEYIIVQDLSGKTIRHPIETLRKATHEEVIKINRAGGPAFAEQMKDFYPVLIQSTRTVSDENPFLDLLMIDHKGAVKDKLLLQAILNGSPVKTKRAESDTIDV